MLIHSPLNSKEEVEVLIRAGTDVFYAGVIGAIFFGKETGVSNRRPWVRANFNSLDELEEAAEMVHKHGRKIHFTINEHFYTEKQIEIILEKIDEMKYIDAFIVSDLGLLMQIRKKFPKVDIVASVGTCIFNMSAVNFYKKLGVNNFVLPRSLSLEEIGEISKFENIKVQCIIKNDDCANIDGLCRFSHGILENEKCSACEMMGNFKFYGKNEKEKEILKNRFKDYHRFLFKKCGACFLHDFSKMKIAGVKIAGRDLELKKRMNDVMFIKGAVEKSCMKSGAEYRKKIKNDYQTIYKNYCGDKCLYN
jgi:U32 family peptidase